MTRTITASVQVGEEVETLYLYIFVVEGRPVVGSIESLSMVAPPVRRVRTKGGFVQLLVGPNTGKLTLHSNQNGDNHKDSGKLSLEPETQGKEARRRFDPLSESGNKFRHKLLSALLSESETLGNEHSLRQQC